MVGYGDFDRTLNTFRAAVTKHPYVCGDTFTAADVYVGSQVAWGLQFGTLPDSPDLRAYVERLHSRPAFKLGTEKDDAAMAEYGPQMPAG